MFLDIESGGSVLQVMVNEKNIDFQKLQELGGQVSDPFKDLIASPS